MRVHFTDDVEEYASTAGPYLLIDPVRCTVPLSIIEYARSGIVHESTWSWVVDDGAVVGIASWSPPHEVVVAPMAADVAKQLAEAWSELEPRPAGWTGPRPEVEWCAEVMAARHGSRVEEKFAERLFRLDAVIDVPSPSGGMRLATGADRDRLVAWWDAFIDETGVTRGREVAREVDVRIADGRLFVWEDHGRVTALTGVSPSVAAVSRVGPVYTPPDERGHGYARGLVAEVSRNRLANGDRSCCLFTDLANPVSNAIYQQVGYRPVADYAQLLVT